MASRRPCPPEAKAGRLAKAKQFLAVADSVAELIVDQEIADAYITLCIHAGIAAADVMCCARLGEHNDGANHYDAVALLGSVDRVSAEHLRKLLAMKTRSGYSPELSADPDMVRAGNSAAALVKAALII